MDLGKIITQMFTTKDNESWDLGRVLWALLVLVFTALTTYQAVTLISGGQPWDAMVWAGAASVILGAGGATLWMKRSTEPGHDDKGGIPPAVMLALALTGLLALGSIAQATVDPDRGLYWNPTWAERMDNPRAIVNQQGAYLDAKDLCSETGNASDCARAWDLALWPVQRAWMLNNRAVNIMAATATDKTELRRAEKMLLQAVDLCADEEVLTGGPGGSRACAQRVQLNLSAVRERLEALEFRRSKRGRK